MIQIIESKGMRPRVPWMNETDDAILEFLESLDTDGVRVWQAPTPVWINVTRNFDALDVSRNTVSRRMGKLAEMGLLERVDEKRGYYKITDKGLAYLSEELDREDISRPES
jgi:DNA-binding transcriptional ArsR family regulator